VGSSCVSLGLCVMHNPIRAYESRVGEAQCAPDSPGDTLIGNTSPRIPQRNGSPDPPSPRHRVAMRVGRGAPFLLIATGGGLVLVTPWARPRQPRRLTDKQMEAIAGVQDRLATSTIWLGASAAWVGEDVTPFRPISPAWAQRQTGRPHRGHRAGSCRRTARRARLSDACRRVKVGSVGR
jgi:hypothetical protein